VSGLSSPTAKNSLIFFRPKSPAYSSPSCPTREYRDRRGNDVSTSGSAREGCCVQSLSHLYVISDFQKLFLTPDPNQMLIPCHPVPREGTLAIVTDVGMGCGGRRCAFDEWRVTRTAKSCGPDAPMAGVKFPRRKLLWNDGDKQARSRRGEHDISCNTIAQGRPDCFR
jgi:hypothetical protein